MNTRGASSCIAGSSVNSLNPVEIVSCSNALLTTMGVRRRFERSAATSRSLDFSALSEIFRIGSLATLSVYVFGGVLVAGFAVVVLGAGCGFAAFCDLIIAGAITKRRPARRILLVLKIRYFIANENLVPEGFNRGIVKLTSGPKRVNQMLYAVVYEGCVVRSRGSSPT